MAHYEVYIFRVFPEIDEGGWVALTSSDVVKSFGQYFLAPIFTTRDVYSEAFVTELVITKSDL